MGMFETYDNVHHRTAPFDLADSCTECHGRGFTAFPINVSTGDEDFAPCPLGCEVPSETSAYYWAREPECALDEELQHAFVLSLRPVATIDPFLILNSSMRRRRALTNRSRRRGTAGPAAYPRSWDRAAGVSRATSTSKPRSPPRSARYD